MRDISGNWRGAASAGAGKLVSARQIKYSQITEQRKGGPSCEDPTRYSRSPRAPDRHRHRTIDTVYTALHRIVSNRNTGDHTKLLADSSWHRDTKYDYSAGMRDIVPCH
eukprot:scaffold21924_cov62-Phaeocystis_antarctica.AAC.6